MDLGERKIWQIACGDTNRLYADHLLEWDVVAIGPGDKGKWHDGYCSEHRQMTIFRRFYKEMSQGDIVVLRLGTSQVYGVGVVADDRVLWLDDFGDVDGWDLQHIRRVKWVWKYCRDRGPKEFDRYTLHWGDTVQRIDAESLKEWMKNEILCADETADVRRLPPSCIDGQVCEETDIAQVASCVFEERTRAECLTKSLGELGEFAERHNSISFPSEHETRAHLVVPLLKALGWPAEWIAIEWKHMDVALFGSTDRETTNPSVIVETKRKGDSCLTARNQATEYAEKHGGERCDTIAVTDGIRYGVYRRNPDGQFPECPTAYINLLRLRKSYPILGRSEQACGGAADALSLMAAR